MSDLKNPMRFSISHRTIDVGGYLGDDKRVTEVEVRPSEGQVYVHWEETGLSTTDSDRGDERDE